MFYVKNEMEKKNKKAKKSKRKWVMKVVSGIVSSGSMYSWLPGKVCASWWGVEKN